MVKIIAVASLALSLGLINWSIVNKEAHLSDGSIVYLQLAPVDPRSLMQGDYMALRFSLASEIYVALPKIKTDQRWRHDVDAGDGFVVVILDEENIASYVRLHNGEALSKNEMLLLYRVRNGAVKFATDAFFFQEGDANVYQMAKYGEFRVDNKGELLLVAMYDESLGILGEGKEM